MSYRSSSPVSGFGGHVPGSKWQVGSKSYNLPNNSQIRSQIEPEPTVLTDHSHTFDLEGNPIQRFSSQYFLPPPMTPAEYTQFYNQQMANFQAAAANGGGGTMMQMQPPSQYYGFNPALSMNGFPQNNGAGMASSASMQGINNASQASPGNQNLINGQPRNDSNGQSQNQSQQQQQQKARSKSMPRKPKSDIRDMFGGIESGWWSEGQALKNSRRHQQSQAEGAASGVSVNGNNSNDHTSSSSTISRYRRQTNGGNRDRDYDDDDVPAPGYSGHIPGIRTHGIGKPFTVAAKESRRIMHANENNTSQSIQAKGRSENNQGNNQQQQQNNASRQQQQFNPPPSMNAYPTQQQQQAFMNSYPFMAPNGVLQPMYMGLPQQGQPQQQQLPNNLQNNASDF